MEERIQKLEQEMREHYHNGVVGRQVDVRDLVGTLKTIIIAADLTNALASKPSRLIDQMFIDTTTATKKLYAYDSVGNVWRAVTIA